MLPSFTTTWSSSADTSSASSKDHFQPPHPRSASSSSQDLKDKPKKPRHRHSAAQLAALNELYDRDEHPPLEDRTSLAERLGMEVKTVNAWFQNKRASCKKRTNKGAANNNNSSSSNNNNSQYELPPISQLIASVSAPSPREYDDSEDDHSFVDRLPPISSSAPAQQRPPRSRSIFYSGNPQHQHLFDTDMNMPRKGRSRPSGAQTEELRKLYDANPHPSKEEREELGHRIGMRYQSVTNWFQNQRSIAKKRKEEEDARQITPPAQQQQHQQARASSSSRNAPFAAAFPPSSGASHPSLSVPPASGHPSLPALPFTHRPLRSPSAAPALDSRTSSPRPSPYGTALSGRSSSVNGRPRRSRPEPQQLLALKELFRRTATPSIEERGALAMEIGMDVGKVTNWFRNLRQTARKRSKRGAEPDDDDDDDDNTSMSADNDYSRNGSRAPSPTHSSYSDRDVHMDMDQDLPDHAALRVKLEEDEQKQRSMYSHSLASNSRSSDMASEEDAQEAVTPSPASSPYPALPQVVQKAAHSPEPRRNISFTLGPLMDMEKTPADLTTTGVKVEDAMLLLSFHHHVVR